MAITRTSFWQNEKRLCSLMTLATPEEPFARWLTCHECGASWMDGNCIRPNVTFRNGTQTETVLYDDWNGTAAYNSTFNPNFKKGE
jgi:hypothetical protein